MRQLDSDSSSRTLILKETNVTKYLHQVAVKSGADPDKRTSVLSRHPL